MLDALVRIAHNIANGPYANEVKGEWMKKFVAATKQTPTLDEYHSLSPMKLLFSAGISIALIFFI